MADERVLQTQQWLNQTYGNNPKFVLVDEDGNTGNLTVKGLIRALQIELELEVDGTFGNGTVNAFNTLFPNGLGVEVEASSQQVTNIIYILQGGCYCKGYNPFGFTGKYNTTTANAIEKLQSDIGLESTNGITTGILMKVLLNTDAYVLVAKGDFKIREIQQALNRKYSDYIGYIPTNGIYERNTNKALIKALQKEIGVTVDGGWGQETIAALPVLQRNGTVKNKQTVYLLQYSLYCNGFDPNGFDGGYGAGVQKAVKNFQTFVKLEADGACGKQTWASLLISYGDKNRTTHVCDTRFEITSDRAKILKNNGYTVVGRYLTGGDFKELRDGEIERMLSEGINMFPIFQENARQASDFTATKGREHAHKAIEAATKKGVPLGSIIYFAVDYDAMDIEVTTNILPYFESIKTVFNSAIDNIYRYKIGVYGARNVCSRVSENGYAISSFVSDMSSGFSGNLGYKLPQNWNYDQIANVTITDPIYGSLEIDKNIYSGNDAVVSDVNKNLYTHYKLKELYDLAYKRTSNIKEANRLVLDFLRGEKYKGFGFDQIAGIVDDKYINSVKENLPHITPKNMIVDCIDISFDMTHFAVVAESYIVNFVGMIEEVREYAGWAGDLCQLGAQMQKNYDENKHLFTESEVMQLVGCNDDEFAKSLKFDNARGTGFDLEDLYNDMDGAVFGKRISDESLPNIFKDYYIDKNYFRRANLFYVALNKKDISGSTPLQILTNLAKIYSNNPIGFSQIFGALFGTFDEKIWGEVLANGYAKKVNSMIEKENNI